VFGPACVAPTAFHRSRRRTARTRRLVAVLASIPTQSPHSHSSGAVAWLCGALVRALGVARVLRHFRSACGPPSCIANFMPANAACHAHQFADTPPVGALPVHDTAHRAEAALQPGHVQGHRVTNRDVQSPAVGLPTCWRRIWASLQAMAQPLCLSNCGMVCASQPATPYPAGHGRSACRRTQHRRNGQTGPRVGARSLDRAGAPPGRVPPIACRSLPPRRAPPHPPRCCAALYHHGRQACRRVARFHQGADR